MELLPDITVTHDDYALLAALVGETMTEGRYVAASRLANELHRARIVPASQMPKECLTLNIACQYLEERSGAIREAAIIARNGKAPAGMVSVLSPVGAALLGLSEGQRIGWIDPHGRPRVLRLLKVRHTEEMGRQLFDGSKVDAERRSRTNGPG